MKLSFKIAARFLKSSKGQTILIALGIAIGVSVQIFIGSLIQGLQKGLVNKTIGNSSQITILSSKEDKTINNWEEIISKIKSSDNRVIKVSPSADSSGFIKLEDKAEPVLMRGFQFENADKIYNLKNRIYKGKMPQNDNEVIVGKDLKEELGLNLDENVDILTPKGKVQKVKIVGFYDLKVSNINKSWVISNMDTVQNIFSLGNKATSIETQVDESDIFSSDIIADNVKKSLNDSNIKVENWKSQNEQLLSGLNGQSVSSIMIQVFVLISVVLGIASVLAITVIQKSKQIGILKAMGIMDRKASLIFLFEGLILGVLGAILGVILGLGLAVAFTKFALNPDGTPVVELYINAKFITLSGVIAILSSALAALIPARRTSKLNTIEVIKNN